MSTWPDQNQSYHVFCASGWNGPRAVTDGKWWGPEAVGCLWGGDCGSASDPKPGIVSSIDKLCDLRMEHIRISLQLYWVSILPCLKHAFIFDLCPHKVCQWLTALPVRWERERLIFPHSQKTSSTVAFPYKTFNFLRCPWSAVNDNNELWTQIKLLYTRKNILCTYNGRSLFLLRVGQDCPGKVLTWEMDCSLEFSFWRLELGWEENGQFKGINSWIKKGSFYLVLKFNLTGKFSVSVEVEYLHRPYMLNWPGIQYLAYHLSSKLK